MTAPEQRDGADAARPAPTDPPHDHRGARLPHDLPGGPTDPATGLPADLPTDLKTGIPGDLRPGMPDALPDDLAGAVTGAVTGAAAEGVLGRTYRALSIGIVSVVLLIAFEATAVGTAMPVAARELDGIPLYAFAFSAYFTTSLFAMVLAGQWADRRGPLRPLTAGIAAFARRAAAVRDRRAPCGCSSLGRAVQGLGGGLVIVALYVVVGRAYPERLRPAIMAAFAASWVVPSVVGPLAAGTVTEHLGWRWVFVGIPVLVVLPLALALPADPADGLRARRTRDAPPPPSTAGASGSRSASRLGAGLLQYAAQDLRWLVAASRPPRASALLVPAVLGLLPARHRTGRRAGCRRWCCCAGSRPGRSSPPSPSCR